MFESNRLTAALAAVLLIASVVPATAAASSGSASGSAAASATVHVRVTENATVVTVRSDGHAVSGADLGVESVGNASYAGSGHYETDANGRVRLPMPDDQATVRVSLQSDSVDGDAVVTLTAPDHGDYETTVTVGADAHAGILAKLDAWLPIDLGVNSHTHAEDGSASADASAKTSTDDHGFFGFDLGLWASADDHASARATADAQNDDSANQTNADDSANQTTADVNVTADGDARFESGNQTSVDLDGNTTVAADGQVDSTDRTWADGDATAESDSNVTADGDSDGGSVVIDGDSESDGGLSVSA